MNLSIINISAIVDPAADWQSPSVLKVAKALVQALTDDGFLYISHHGIDVGLQNELEDMARAFFAKKEAEKLFIRMENAGRRWKGYFPVGAELTSGIPDQKEGLYFGTELPADHPAVLAKTPMHGPNQWADPNMQRIVLQYMDSQQRLGETLMRAVGLGLGLGVDYFANRYANNPTCLFRIFNYPSLAKNEGDDWSVRQHTDMGFLTILRQDLLGGLEVQRQDGEWIKAPPIENTFVINIGDMLELWTWGKLRATLHRVRNTASKDRLSFPFFFDPSWDRSLERIDKSLLGDVPEISSAEQRWDQLDLAKISDSSTYGDFVWAKISRVFPQLAN